MIKWILGKVTEPPVSKLKNENFTYTWNMVWGHIDPIGRPGLRVQSGILMFEVNNEIKSTKWNLDV